MARTFIVTRDVTPEECHWLTTTIKRGHIVHEYNGCTYGCIGSGIAVTDNLNETPFYEMPRSALDGGAGA
jgi:hypothetical protein